MLFLQHAVLELWVSGRLDDHILLMSDDARLRGYLHDRMPPVLRLVWLVFPLLLRRVRASVGSSLAAARSARSLGRTKVSEEAGRCQAFPSLDWWGIAS
jgi:hypothetical protein